MKAVSCKEGNRQYSRDFSALQESEEACVIVEKLACWVLAMLCVAGMTPALIGYLSLKFFSLCVIFCTCKVLCRHLSVVERAFWLEGHGQKKCKIKKCYLRPILKLRKNDGWNRYRNWLDWRRTVMDNKWTCLCCLEITLYFLWGFASGDFCPQSLILVVEGLRERFLDGEWGKDWINSLPEQEPTILHYFFSFWYVDRWHVW